MATRFEIALWGDDESRLRAAGQEALAEIAAIERRISPYDPASDIYNVNAHASECPVPIDCRVLALLQQSARLSAATDGAFDITVGPLLVTWGFTGGSGHMPSPDAVAEARRRVGWQQLELNSDTHSVRFAIPGMRIDVGAIGKGYAIEQAAATLVESQIGGALIHGGTSTVQAVGGQPDGTPWLVAIRDPANPEQHACVLPLLDRALSVSAPHGKCFTHDGVTYGHVLDPRPGAPAPGADLSVVCAPSATDTDALSTALLVLGEEFLPTLLERFPGADGMVGRIAAGNLSISATPNLDTAIHGHP